MPTCTWLSAAVEKTWAFLVGMVVLLRAREAGKGSAAARALVRAHPTTLPLVFSYRVIRRVNTPPSVSMPSDRGVTSRRRRSRTSPRSTPP